MGQIGILFFQDNAHAMPKREFIDITLVLKD